MLFTLFFHFFANVEHSQTLPQSVKEGQSFIMQIMYFYCLIGTINFLCLAVLSQRVRGLFLGRHSLMAGLRIPIQFLEELLPPVFESKCPFFIYIIFHF